GKGPHFGATRGQYSNEFSMLTKRSGQEGARAVDGAHHWEIVLLAGVRNMERAMLAHPTILWFIDTDLDAANGYGTKMGPLNQSVPLAQSQHHIINPANPCGALHDSVEHRLHVRRRAADDTEHLRCSRLMLEGFAQLCVALLQFLKQADILDGNDSLVRESFQKRDMFLCKGTDLRAAN